MPASITGEGMSYTDAVARVAEIQRQGAALNASPQTAAPSTSFASALAAAQAPSATAPAPFATSSGSALPESLTSGQRQFAERLSADTGLDTGVIGAWLLSEESGGASQARQAANNNDWLNIGYTDSGTFGGADSIWSDPIQAADATAGWLKGQDTIPGYGKASQGIQAILSTAGQAPQSQIAAIQGSGWASSGYPDLPGLYQQVAG
jgi:hypothetical protein